MRNHTECRALAERLIWARERKSKLDGADFTQATLAQKAGVSQGSIGHLESGRTSTSRKLTSIAAALEVDPVWLADGKGHPEWGSFGTAPDQPAQSVTNAMPVSVDPEDPNSYRIQKVRLQLRAGVTGFQTVPEIHDGGTINLPKNWVDRKGYVPETLIAISVTGDSMEPRIYEGDTVVINTMDRKLVDGEVYAVNFEGEAVIKRLVRERGEWWLFSDSPDQVKHRPKGCREGECNIVGRVVWKGSERI